MDLKIKNARLENIDEIASLVAKSWYKHKFFELGYRYDKLVVIKKIKEYLDSPIHYFYVGRHGKRIVGYLLLVEVDSIFCNQKMLVQIALQSDPELGKTGEARVIKQFMNFTDDFIKKGDYSLQCMTMSHSYDFTEHLLKKGYKLSDKIFTRKVR